MKTIVIITYANIIIFSVLMLLAIVSSFQMGPFPTVAPDAIAFAIVVSLLITALCIIHRQDREIGTIRILWGILKVITAGSALFFIAFLIAAAVFFFGFTYEKKAVKEVKEVEEIQTQICTDDRLSECS